MQIQQMKTRQYLRLTMKTQRLALPEVLQKKAATVILKSVQNDIDFQNAHTVASYVPHLSEVDASRLWTTIQKKGKSHFLPVMKNNRSEKKLFFVQHRAGMPLKANVFGILEPLDCGSHVEKIDPLDLDMIFLPLLAVNTEGYRLGYGGGYYDRTFEAFIQQPNRKKPRLAGLAYSFQVQADFLSEKHDIPLSKLFVSDGSVHSFL